MPQKRRVGVEYVTIHFRADTSLAALVRAAAAQEDVTISQYVRRLVRDYFRMMQDNP